MYIHSVCSAAGHVIISQWSPVQRWIHHGFWVSRGGPANRGICRAAEALSQSSLQWRIFLEIYAVNFNIENMFSTSRWNTGAFQLDLSARQAALEGYLLSEELQSLEKDWSDQTPSERCPSEPLYYGTTMLYLWWESTLQRAQNNRTEEGRFTKFSQSTSAPLENLWKLGKTRNINIVSWGAVQHCHDLDRGATCLAWHFTCDAMAF